MKSLLILALLGALPGVAMAQNCPNQPTGLPIMHIAFTPPTTNTDGTPLALPISYNVYLGNAPGKETLYKTGLTFNPITLKNLQHGQIYYAYLATVDAKGAVSVPSDETCKSFFKK
jgi:hypothetical protein